MANKKVSELNVATATAAADLLMLIHAADSKNITVANFLANLDGDTKPLTTATYNLGSSLKQWLGVYAGKLLLGTLTNVSTENLYIGSDSSVVANLDTRSDTVSSILQATRTRGTQASPTTVSNNDILFAVKTKAKSGSSMFDVAKLEFAVDGAVTSGQAPASRFDFYTNTVNNSLVLNATLNATGIFSAKGFGIKGGAAGVSFGPAAPASITVVNGIITAIS